MLIKALDQSIKKQSRFGATFLMGFSSLIAVLLLVELAVQRPDVWNLHFSWYALLSGVGVIINLLLMYFIARRPQSTDMSVRYSLMVGCFTLLGLSETMQRLSTQPGAAMFWRDLTLIGGVLSPIALLIFVFHYTARHTLEHYKQAITTVFAASLLLIYLGLTTNLIYVNQVSRMFATFYGYEIDLGPASVIYFLWIQVILTMALVELILYRRLVPSGPKYRQAQIFFVAIIFLIVSTSIDEVVLPALNIVALPLGSTLSTIFACIVAYGITIRGIFTVNPAMLVANILDTMADSVIVTDTDFTILYTNKFTAVHLQLQEHKMVGQNISEFLEAETFTKIKNALTLYEPGKEIAIIDQGEMKTDNYEQRYVNISLSKVVDSGQLVGYIFSFANNSEPRFRADMEKGFASRHQPVSETTPAAE